MALAWHLLNFINVLLECCGIFLPGFVGLCYYRRPGAEQAPVPLGLAVYYCNSCVCL